MATYHICDLCGKDIKDNHPAYFIEVHPEIGYRGLSMNMIRNTTKFERICSMKKEICEDCAKAWVDNFNKLDEFKSTPDWEAKIKSPKYETVSGEMVYHDDFYKMDVTKYS